MAAFCWRFMFISWRPHQNSGGFAAQRFAGKLNWHKDKLTTESSAQSTECLNLYGPTRQSSLVSFYSRRFILDASLRFGQSQKPYDLYYSSLWRNWQGRLLHAPPTWASLSSYFVHISQIASVCRIWQPYCIAKQLPHDWLWVNYKIAFSPQGVRKIPRFPYPNQRYSQCWKQHFPLAVAQFSFACLEFRSLGQRCWQLFLVKVAFKMAANV